MGARYCRHGLANLCHTSDINHEPRREKYAFCGTAQKESYANREAKNAQSTKVDVIRGSGEINGVCVNELFASANRAGGGFVNVGEDGKRSNGWEDINLQKVSGEFVDRGRGNRLR